jgi:hypothetical protein
VCSSALRVLSGNITKSDNRAMPLRFLKVQ